MVVVVVKATGVVMDSSLVSLNENFFFIKDTTLLFNKNIKLKINPF